MYNSHVKDPNISFITSNTRLENMKSERKENLPPTPS